MLHKLFLCTLVLQALWLIACSDSKKNGGSGNIGQQLQNDKAQLSLMPETAGRSVDKNMNGAFSKMFGGPSGEHLNQFISLRASLVYDLDELVQFPVYGTFKGRFKSGLIKDLLVRPFENFNSKQYRGLNVGAFLHAIARSQGANDMIVSLNGKNVPIVDPRIGLIGLHPQYREYKGVQLSPIGSLNTVAHEARHSDCTGGYKSGGNEKCHYNHSICGSEFAGTEYYGRVACDAMPWGAYTVSILHAAAAAFATKNPAEFRIMDVIIKDYSARMSSEVRSKLWTTEPDLSSTAD